MADIIAVTGHRPDKLGGYSPKAEGAVYAVAFDWLRDNRPALVITGMALGWDQAVADACADLKIPFVAAVPFPGQESRWPEPSQHKFRHLLSPAHDVYYVTRGPYSNAAMHARNHWVVDHCERVVALWDGSSGGTGACVGYADKVKRPVVNLWPAFRP